MGHWCLWDSGACGTLGCGWGQGGLTHLLRYRQTQVKVPGKRRCLLPSTAKNQVGDRHRLSPVAQSTSHLGMLAMKPESPSQASMPSLPTQIQFPINEIFSSSTTSTLSGREGFLVIFPDETIPQSPGQAFWYPTWDFNSTTYSCSKEESFLNSN